jgi:hypothetical protein
MAGCALIHIDTLNIRDDTGVTLISQRLSHAIVAASLGTRGPASRRGAH